MKKILVCAVAALALLSCAKKEKSVTYTNPLDVAYGDPFVLHASDGRFYMYGTSGEAGADELASYLSQTDHTPMGALLRDECEVWAKPGWYPADENNLTSTNDAGVVFSDDGTYVLVVMTDLSADLDRLTSLIDALDAAHDVMCGG